MLSLGSVERECCHNYDLLEGEEGVEEIPSPFLVLAIVRALIWWGGARG
jgi:hypothetical protein